MQLSRHNLCVSAVLVATFAVGELGGANATPPSRPPTVRAAASPRPSQCEILTSISFSGDTTIGSGCEVLVLGNGVIVSVQNATRVDVLARSIRVNREGRARIRVTGTKGLTGAAGRNGDSYPKWQSGGAGDPDTEYANAVADAKRDPKNGCHGRDGEPGKAGDSPVVRLPVGVAVRGTLVVEALGGPGGDGGPGGGATTLANGRNNYIDGGMYACRNGANGPLGSTGPVGAIQVGGKPRALGMLLLK